MILTVTMNPAIDTAYQLDKLIIDDVNRVAQEDRGRQGPQRQPRAVPAGR